VERQRNVEWEDEQNREESYEEEEDDNINDSQSVYSTQIK
jgi:hypothetical protein